MAVKNQLQLITYPDSLSGNLKTRNALLLKYFRDIFKGGVHILPPFPSSCDRGFAPKIYLEIEPTFGTCDDIGVIAGNFDVMLDLTRNHISRQFLWFRIFFKWAVNWNTLTCLLPSSKYNQLGNRKLMILIKCS